MNNITVTEKTDSAKITNEISIFDILILMMRKWWIIILTGMIFAIICYAYTKSVSVPSYVSSGSLYIDTQREQATDDVNATALQQAADLMPTYIQILKSRTFNQVVSDAMDNLYTPDAINGMVKLSQVENTNIINVSVTCTDKEHSYQLCNSVIDLADDEILRIFEGGSVKVIDKPKEEPRISVVNLFRRGIVGFMVGAALATIVIVLFDIFDTRITGSEELTSRYKVPILGEIPNLTEMS